MSDTRREQPRRGLPDLFDWAEGLPGLFSWPPQMASRGIRVEEFVDDGRYVVRAELPGLDPQRDVRVHVAEGMVTIRAERREEHRDDGRSEFRYGTFTRRVPLPSAADESQVRAVYESGILEISVPMKGGQQPQAREVPVQQGR